MNIEQRGEILTVSDLKELGAVNAHWLRDEVRAALQPELKTIEIDLSQTGFIDSCGLGALISLYKTASHQNNAVTFRLVNPTLPVQQVFELTRLHRFFEIVKRPEPRPSPPPPPAAQAPV